MDLPIALRSGTLSACTFPRKQIAPPSISCLRPSGARRPDLPRPPAPPRKQAPDLGKLPVIQVRVGEFENFTRLIFDWPSAVRYTTTPGQGRIRIRFEAMARLDFSMLESRPAAWVKSTEARLEGEATLVDIATDAESAFRDSKDGLKVVIDILAPKTDASAIAQAGKTGDPSSILLTPAAPDSASKSASPLRGSVASAAGQAAIATSKASQTATTGPRAELARDGAILSFPDARGRAAAVFSRGGTLWIVLDNHPALDAASLLSPLAGLLLKADANQISGAAVLRLVFRTPHLPSVSDTETALRVSLSTGNATPPSPVALTRQGAEGQMALSASVPGASRVLALDDLDAADRILVVPARAGRGMLTPKRFVELMVLPSAAGLAVIPYADDIQATIRGEIVRFARPEGLALSAGSGAATEPADSGGRKQGGAGLYRFRALGQARERTSSTRQKRSD